MTLLTLFTAPKPFTDPHIATIQRNAIQSWSHLGQEVEVILIGEEDGLKETAADLGVRHLPDAARNAQGTPLVSSIFSLARQHSTGRLLGYVNADILFTPEIVNVCRKVCAQAEKFLVVGQRWDLDIRFPLDFNPGWDERLLSDVRQRGRLHPPGGSDYFVFPRECFREVPDFAIGRAGWDNWMIYEGRREGWSVIDATGDLIIVHQDHDYRHLPGGQAHYRLPETAENMRLAGGRRTIFSLKDASHTLEKGQVKPIPIHGQKLLREMETYPLVRLHSRALAELSFALFHPVKAWGEWRGRVQYLLKKRWK